MGILLKEFSILKRRDPMIVVFQTILSTILNLKRTCPRCRRVQFVPPPKRDKTVGCKYRGQEILPVR